MVEPSNSHTVGAVKIGYVARKLLVEPVAEAEINLYGSFLAASVGHGTRYTKWRGRIGFDTGKKAEKKMREIEISLNSIDKVKNFVSIVTIFDADINLVSGRDIIVDAKSIMGIFSLDLSKPIGLRIQEGKENVDDIINALSEYVKG